MDTTRRPFALNRSVKNTFLIYCEGVSTEPEYFKAFPVTTETEIKAVGLGRSRTALVEKVIQLAKFEGFLKDQKEFDPERQIWCVFDKDTEGAAGEDEDFDNAIILAEEQGIKVAYSNDSFELWLVLHDRFLDSALHRSQFYDILTKKLGYNYERYGKEKNYAKKLYAFFEKTQSQALNHAAKLHKKQADLKPSIQNPCTLVYELVKELNKCLRK
jgi:hypothetical protein